MSLRANLGKFCVIVTLQKGSEVDAMDLRKTKRTFEKIQRSKQRAAQNLETATKNFQEADEQEKLFMRKMLQPIFQAVIEKFINHHLAVLDLDADKVFEFLRQNLDSLRQGGCQKNTSGENEPAEETGTKKAKEVSKKGEA